MLTHNCCPITVSHNHSHQTRLSNLPCSNSCCILKRRNFHVQNHHCCGVTSKLHTARPDAAGNLPWLWAWAHPAAASHWSYRWLWLCWWGFICVFFCVRLLALVLAPNFQGAVMGLLNEVWQTHCLYANLWPIHNKKSLTGISYQLIRWGLRDKPLAGSFVGTKHGTLAQNESESRLHWWGDFKLNQGTVGLSRITGNTVLKSTGYITGISNNSRNHLRFGSFLLPRWDNMTNILVSCVVSNADIPSFADLHFYHLCT